MNAFVTALLEICEEEGNTVTVESIRNKALEKLAAGELKSLVSSTINGKAFNFQINLPAHELFSQASEAIRLFNRGINRSTEMDFSSF
jgi:hypothetical protein